MALKITKHALGRFENALNANFLKELGIKLIGYEYGVTEFGLEVKEKHHQQHGYVHAGVRIFDSFISLIFFIYFTY